MTDSPTPAPAAPTAPVTAPEAAPAASAPTSAKAKRAALAASLKPVEDAVASSEPGELASTPEPAPAPAPATPPATDRLEALRAKLARDAAERVGKREKAEQAARVEALQKQLDATQQQPSMEAFLAEYARAPVATLRKYKIDTRKHLDALTQDALSPGSLEAEAKAVEAQSAGKAALERMDRWEKEQREREAAATGHRHNAEFLALTSPADDTKFPLLSKLPEARRLRLALVAWADLAHDHEYSKELVAEYVEAQLEEDHKSWSPPAPPPSAAPQTPSRQTGAPPASQVATKQSPRTITPELTGATSGAARPKTKAERRAALAARLVAVETDS